MVLRIIFKEKVATPLQFNRVRWEVLKFGSDQEDKPTLTTERWLPFLWFSNATLSRAFLVILFAASAVIPKKININGKYSEDISYINNCFTTNEDELEKGHLTLKFSLSIYP